MTLETKAADSMIQADELVFPGTGEILALPLRDQLTYQHATMTTYWSTEQTWYCVLKPRLCASYPFLPLLTQQGTSRMLVSCFAQKKKV